MRNMNKYIETARAELNKQTRYDLTVAEIRAFKQQYDDVRGVEGLLLIIYNCFLFGFECGRRSEKNKKKPTAKSR